MKAALLVIDVQRALCEGIYQVFDARQVVERINSVAGKARAANAPVIVVQHESASPLLAYGSEGWQLCPDLHTEDTDIFLRKTAADCFHKTELDLQLRQRGVSDLIICGMQSDFCVDTTTRRALALGYSVTLVRDGHSTLDNECLSASQIVAHHNATLANITSFGPVVKLVPADEVSIEAR